MTNDSPPLHISERTPVIDQIIAAREAALAEIDAADSLESVTALDTRLLGKKGRLAQLKTQLGGLATVEEKKAAGQAVNEALQAAPRRPRRAQRGCSASRPRRTRAGRTARPDRVRRACRPAATRTSSRRRGSGSRTSSSGSASRSPKGPRSRPTGTTSRHSTWARAIRRVASSTRCSSTTRRPVASPGTHGAAHSHVTGPDPHDAHAGAADLHRRARPRVPPRHPRRHAHAGVPPDRGARHRSQHHARRPGGDDRGVHQGVLRRRVLVAPAARRTSRSPSRRPSSTSSGPTARGSSSAGAAWCTPTCCGRVGIDPEVWSGFAFGFGIDRMAVMRHQIADIRDMFANDLRFIEQF